MTPDRLCFVIAPIGDDKSEVRKRSDQVFKHIVTPAANECGYKPMRADHIDKPGIITSQVIQHIVDAPLVIADLTGRNPNVFYELAIRHAIKKPVVQIIESNEAIPFDIAATRIIQFDHHDMDSVATARDQIIKQIKAVERDPSQVDTPISVAVQLQSLKQSDNPLEKTTGQILGMLQDILAKVSELSLRTPTISPPAYERLSPAEILGGARALAVPSSKLNSNLEAINALMKQIKEEREKSKASSGRKKHTED